MGLGSMTIPESRPPQSPVLLKGQKTCGLTRGDRLCEALIRNQWFTVQSLLAWAAMAGDCQKTNQSLLKFIFSNCKTKHWANLSRDLDSEIPYEMAHVLLLCNRINTKPRQGYFLKKYLFVFPKHGCKNILKSQFHLIENSSEWVARCWGSLLLAQSTSWHPSESLSKEGWLFAVFILWGKVARLRLSQGSASFAPAVFVQVSAGFVALCVSPQFTVLQSFTKTSLSFTSAWTLRTPGAGCFLQVKLQQDQRVWQLAQRRLTQVLLSEGLLPHWLHLPWSLQLEWTFRNHHVHSHLCFLASFLSDGFPRKTLSATWMSQVDSTCCGLGRKCLWSV